MKRALYVLFFLSLVPEYPQTWGLLEAPLQWFTRFLEWNPLKLPMIDVLILAILVLAKDRAKRQRTKAMLKTIWLSLGALLVWITWGAINGGNLYQVQFQLHNLIISYVLAFAIAKVLVTPADFLGLGKTLFAAAVYRGCTAIAFYVDKVLVNAPKPECCTSHSDSVLFVMGIISAIAYSVEFRGTIKRSAKTIMIVGIVIIVTAIQFNNRRLAWVSLVGALILLYFMLPTNPFKKRINKKLFWIAPVLAVYVVVGTGRPEKIFSPLKALSSVKSDEDKSTKSRDNENAGLLVTLGLHPYMGTGWGQQYIEIDATLSAGTVGFTQYRYLPHNSVLGLLAFTGVLGFASIWMVFPMCTFLLAYTYRRAQLPIVRAASLVGVTEVLVVTNQWYGDLGLTFQLPGLIMASGFAAAIRLPNLIQVTSTTGNKAKSS
jgi:hypothetical protein